MNNARQLFGRPCAPFLALALLSASCTDNGSGGAETGSSSSSSSGPATSGSTTSSTTGSGPTTSSGTTGSESSSTTEASTSGTEETGGSSSSSESGGSSSTGSQVGTFDEARSYEAFWTTSDEHCAQQMKQGVNCSYLVSFCPDGSSAVVWTDIVGDGTYTLDGTSIAAQWSDVEFSPVDFEYDPESDTLQDSVFSETWARTFEYPLLDCD